MDSSLLPLKSFVRSLKQPRTYGSVMQTALCYLGAIRPQVPEILCDQKCGIRSYFLPESVILPATEAKIQLDRKLSNLEESIPLMTSDELLKTVPLIDEDVDIKTDRCEMSSLT